MSDEIDEARREGARQEKVEGRLTNLETQVGQIKKIGLGIVTAILAAWAREKGLF